ncbi:MAG: methionine biosynthesis protein MetW [Gammaproteobacteria bacterium]|nr:methionine biosynthesis protein MetW [Gammaproteobacteria bacterium]
MRSDLEFIASLVHAKSRVLDLGCGDGALLSYLAREKSVTGYGVDDDSSAIATCLAKGVNVIEHDLNEGLSRFPDDSFDMVLMTETLQATLEPHKLVRELLRIGQECIVTFPNFAHWSCRIHMLSRGTMPVSTHLPHQWYNTPNIHLCTVKDFDELCASLDLRVIDRFVVDNDYQSGRICTWWPNLFGATAFYRLGRQ